MPIFIFDPRYFNEKTKYDTIKCSAKRAKFILDSVKDLRQNLEAKGSGLYVFHGKPEEIFKDIVSSNKIQSISCQEEVASEELRIDSRVKKILDDTQTFETIWGSTMYAPEDLPFHQGVNGMPNTFTPFRNKVEKNCAIGKPLASPEKISLAKGCDDDDALDEKHLSYMPTLSELGYDEEDAVSDERGVMTFKGGETAALERVKDYIWTKDMLRVYFDTRNGMIGPDYSTKFSPWLAYGCLSPRYVADQCQKYEEARVKNKSTYWVVFELLWRDFFKFFAQKQGNQIFFLDGILGEDAKGNHPNSRRWGLDKRTLQKWKDGETGYPLVDANMRELKHTGFMSNRGRQNVASFLALDTNTDWRYGAYYFEQELLDYDIYSNWGNWASAAGMTGGRLNKFNIPKQSKDYDQKGDYVRLWCPELKNLPNSLVHEPWKITKEQEEQYDFKLGVDYPKPCVEPWYPRPRNNDRRDNSRRGNNNNSKRNNKNNSNGKGNKYTKGQRKEMKSLKQGSYKFE